MAAQIPIIRAYQTSQPAIQLLTAIVEASDGIGLVRTLDETRGIIECWMMPDFVDVFEIALDAVAKQWPIQFIGTEFE